MYILCLLTVHQAYILYIYVNHRFNVPEYKETIHAYAYTMYVCYFTVRICISHLMIFYIQ